MRLLTPHSNIHTFVLSCTSKNEAAIMQRKSNNNIKGVFNFYYFFVCRINAFYIFKDNSLI